MSKLREKLRSVDILNHLSHFLYYYLVFQIAILTRISLSLVPMIPYDILLYPSAISQSKMLVLVNGNKLKIDKQQHNSTPTSRSNFMFFYAF